MRYYLLILLLIAFVSAEAQKKKKTPKNLLTVAFYNQENLFDTEDDPTIDDSEFLPTSANQWDEAKYQKKLANMAYAISTIGHNAPDILGLCEVENRRVLEDLIKQEKLAKHNYGIVHYNSPDERGIDVALIYKKSTFQPFADKSLRIELPNGDKTRDVLLVSGILAKKDTLHVFVVHFPSRREGMEVSEPRRIAAASRVRQAVDSLFQKNPQSNIILMGDWNDEPYNKSLTEVLRSKADAQNLQKGELFNPMGRLKAEGFGSHAHYNSREKKVEWNVLDQVILSQNLLNKKSKLQYLPNSATIYKPDFLLQQEPAQYKGQPLRTFAGKRYLAGYSDHLPVFVNLKVK
jgi:endonuclease/exonuclease/phosphatase family metal-dependent hydrolase